MSGVWLFNPDKVAVLGKWTGSQGISVFEHPVLIKNRDLQFSQRLI